MTVYTRELRVQAGKETVWGTPVAPTILLRGMEDFKPRAGIDVTMLEDMSLGLSGSSEAVVGMFSPAGTVSGWCSYDHLPYWLDSLLAIDAAPTGAGPDYTYEYAAPTTTAPTLRMMTLVNSDSTVGGYGLNGAIVNSLTLTAEPTGVLQFSADLLGHSMAADSLESLTAPDVTPILNSHQDTFAWDAWGGTMGGTSLADCFVRSWELTMNANRSYQHCFGALGPNTWVDNAWESTMRLSLEFNATTKTDVTAIIGGTLTQKQMEIVYTNTASYGMTIQYAGTVTEDPEIFSDDDGIVTVDIVLSKTYHSTFANWVTIDVTNTLSALT